MTSKVTNVYVDAFNLYYNAVKGTAFKWLDIAKMMSSAFPRNQIHRIRYFTAKVQSRPDDPQKPQRQDIYLRALKTIPNLEIHLGRFSSHVKSVPLANANHRFVDVIVTEEKGSDVNLATYLLYDSFIHDCEAAIVVSNDSDLMEPVNIVNNLLHVPVGIFNPQRKRSLVARDLRAVAAFYRTISLSDLKNHQFAGTLVDARGVFTKPAGW